jgi:ABC-2 type transport system ATP-binding protein
MTELHAKDVPNDLVISARGLTRRFGDTLALDHIDLDIPKGRIVGLIGPNGAGKTTALKAILGLAAYEGSLSVLGLSPFTQRQALMQRATFIADTAVLPKWARVQDLVDYTQAVHPSFDANKCLGYLKQTSVKPQMRVKALSKGMVVQAHLAIIMAIDAELLVLDEPTLGLDILFRKRFYEQLVSDYFDHERTIIITTHQVEEIEALLTDLIFIKEGKIILHAPMEAIANRFLEVEVGPQELARARALKPWTERKTLSRHILMFDGVPREALAGLGPVRTPSVADLFVACMGGLSMVEHAA